MHKKWDWILFLLILGLGSISLLVIFSINRTLAINQLIFWVIGLFILFSVSFLDYKNWQKLSLPFYLLALFFLSLLFLIGEPIRGSIRWIDLGIFRFQPSEVAKIASILVLSTFYLGRSAKEIKNVVISFLIILPAIILILIQPDIGNTLAFLGIWLGLSLFRGFKFRYLFTLAVLGCLSLFLIYHFLPTYQQARIDSFLNPNADPLGTGYNILQSKIAVGSGEFFGKGLGQGSQSQLKFLPEAESDFIFASIAEQLGFLGSIILLILYATLITKIIRFAKNYDGFAQLILIATTSYLLIQFFVNVGMNMGLTPITGITLPLISYGGSSLISTLFILGIVFSIKRSRFLD